MSYCPDKRMQKVRIFSVLFRLLTLVLNYANVGSYYKIMCKRENAA